MGDNDCASDPFKDCDGRPGVAHKPWCYWYVGTGDEDGRYHDGGLIPTGNPVPVILGSCERHG